MPPRKTNRTRNAKAIHSNVMSFLKGELDLGQVKSVISTRISILGVKHLSEVGTNGNSILDDIVNIGMDLVNKGDTTTTADELIDFFDFVTEKLQPEQKQKLAEKITNNNFSLLHAAAARGNPILFEKVLDFVNENARPKHKEIIANQITSTGFSLLLSAAASKNHTIICGAATFTEHHASDKNAIQQLDVNGNSCLANIAGLGNARTFEYAYYAVKNTIKDQATFELLATPNKDGYNAMHQASASMNPGLIREVTNTISSLFKKTRDKNTLNKLFNQEASGRYLPTDLNQSKTAGLDHNQIQEVQEALNEAKAFYENAINYNPIKSISSRRHQNYAEEETKERPQTAPPAIGTHTARFAKSSQERQSPG